MKTHYLKASLRIFAGIVLILWLSGCITWKDVTPPVGEYETKVSITVQEAWCDFYGQDVNGMIRYNTLIRNFCDICVSLQSRDPEQTMRHELDHCWRNTTGLDAKARNQ